MNEMQRLEDVVEIFNKMIIEQKAKIQNESDLEYPFIDHMFDSFGNDNNDKFASIKSTIAALRVVDYFAYIYETIINKLVFREISNEECTEKCKNLLDIFKITSGKNEAYLKIKIYQRRIKAAEEEIKKQNDFNIVKNIIKKENKEYVYFIQNDLTKHIKIGYSSNVKQRFNTIETASGSSMTLLLLIEGNRRDERNFHLMFDLHRAKGEWFYPNEEIESFLKKTVSINKDDHDLILEINKKIKKHENVDFTSKPR